MTSAYRVCLLTGDAGKDASHLVDDPDILGHLYVGPYFEYEPELAFVLEDADGVCGYVLGALDTRSFRSRLFADWLPGLRARYPDPSGDPRSWTESQRLHHKIHHPGNEPAVDLEAYPSHLHIDLLPRAQGMGEGRRMIERLIAALSERGSVGVHLEVHPTNLRAIAFYEKLGFEGLRGGRADAVYMGRRI